MKIPSNILLETLKEYKTQGFTTLLDIVCIDLTSENKYFFLLVYTLFNPVNKEVIEIETNSNGDIDSVTSAYENANYDEMEIFDLFGVKFKQHPNLKRLLLSEDYTGHPMQNTYKQEDLRF